MNFPVAPQRVESGKARLRAGPLPEERELKMIFDAKIEVTCDKCSESIVIEPDFVYSDYSGQNGYYDTSESSIHKKLEQEGWFLEGDKQYCCAECVPE